MKRYIKLFLALIKNNLIREMEFRANFFMACVAESLWMVFQILIISVYFQYTNTLVGWSMFELIAFTGIYRIIRSVFDLFVYRNFMNFSELINRGDFDYILVKPINSLFLTSFRRHRYEDIVELVGGIGIFIYALLMMGQTLTLTRVLWLIGAVVMGSFAYYSLALIIVTFAIFLTRITALSDINNVVSNMLRYPTGVFSRGDRLMDLLLLPLAVIVTYPVQLVLGKISAIHIALEIFFLFLLFMTAYRFWNFALKHYSSASS